MYSILMRASVEVLTSRDFDPSQAWAPMPLVAPDSKKRAKYVPTERCKDLVKVFLSLSLWADRWVPDTKRPKMAGVINEEVTEIGLQVIPFNKEEENKIIKLSKRLAN